MNGTGLYSPSELFGSKWDKEDPLAQDTYNQNLWRGSVSKKRSETSVTALNRWKITFKEKRL